MTLRSRWASLVTLAGILTVCCGSIASAATPSFDLTSSYDIQADKRINVQQTFTSAVTSSEPPFASATVPTLGSDLKNISGKLADGTVLTVTNNDSQHAVQVDFANVSKKNRVWSFVVTYSAKADSDFGKVEGFFIAPLTFSGLSIGKHMISVTYDASLGLATVSSPKPSSEKLAAGKELVSFESSKGVFTKPIGLHFGDSTVAAVDISQSLANNGWWWKTLSIVLPADTNQQQVSIDSLNPKPNHIQLDDDGNIVADYRLRPHQKIAVTGKVMVRLTTPTYDLQDNTSTVAEYPDLVRSRYTKLGDGVLASDSAIVTSIRDLYDKSTASSSANKAQDLLDSLQQKGFAARLVKGIQFKSTKQSVLHDWVEVYVPKVGWVTLDPDAGLDFAAADFSRLAGRIGSGDFVVSTGSIHFETASDLPKSTDTVQLSSTNYMIVPGISLGTTIARLPKGAATDSNALQYANGTTLKLGSLAPLQTASSRRLLLGGKAFASEEVRFGTLADGETLSNPVTTSSHTSYIYLIYGVSFVMFLVILRIIRSTLRKRASHHVANPVEPQMPDMPIANESERYALNPQTPAPNMSSPVVSSRPVVSVRPRMPYRDPVSSGRRRPPTLIQ